MQGSVSPARQPDTGQLVTALELSKLSGVSVATIGTLARSKMIPRPVRYDGSMPIFDLADQKLSAWLKALQAAGYHRR
jgi:DNA-binding transcriptional MerR regulator